MEPARERRISPVWEHFDLITPNNPLEYWERQKWLDPNLYNLALAFWCTPASSLPCERVFLRAREVKRNNFQPKSVERLLYLNKNKWNLPFLLHNLPYQMILRLWEHLHTHTEYIQEIFYYSHMWQFMSINYLVIHFLKFSHSQVP